MKKVILMLSGALLTFLCLTGCMGMGETVKDDMNSAANDVKDEVQSALPTDDNNKSDMDRIQIKNVLYYAIYDKTKRNFNILKGSQL